MNKLIALFLIFTCSVAQATFSPQPSFSAGTVNYFGPRCAYAAAGIACTNDTAGTVVVLLCRTTGAAGTCSGRLPGAPATNANGWTSALKLRITSITALRGAVGEATIGYSDNDGLMAGSVSYTNYKGCNGEQSTTSVMDFTSVRTYNMDCLVPAGKYVSMNQALAGTWQITGVLE
jgi:hypothetical protein